MTSLVNAVSQLETRKAQLEGELADVNAKLKAIQQALESMPGAAVAAPAEVAVAYAAPAVAATPSARAKSKKPVQWFKPGEAAMLVKRLARRPLRPAELVELMAKEKGYEGLAPEQLQRFKGAAFMAITSAVRSKVAVKNKGGLVQAA